MIKAVIRLRNDEVMVFDNEGEQVPRYQGPYQGVKQAILDNAVPDTLFLHWSGYTDAPELVCKSGW